MKDKKHLSIVGFGKDRDSFDFYPTPPPATLSLMYREKFNGNVWECASGDGRMSRVIEKFNDCISSDKRRDDSVYGEKGVDFLKTFRKVDNVITNPPYKYAQEFVEHALKCADKKVAMFLKLVFLEGTGRYKFFRESPLKTVYVFCKRQKIYKYAEKGSNASMIAFAWFVWDKSYEGKPNIDWINSTRPIKTHKLGEFY